MTVTIVLDEKVALELAAFAESTIVTPSWRKYHGFLVPLHEALTNAMEWETVQAHVHGPVVDAVSA